MVQCYVCERKYFVINMSHVTKCCACDRQKVGNAFFLPGIIASIQMTCFQTMSKQRRNKFIFSCFLLNRVNQDCACKRSERVQS